MVVDEEFLRNYVLMLDSFISMTRDKLVFQNLAIPFLGDGWKDKFEKARSDPHFLGEWEIEIAQIQQMRVVAADMLHRLQRGDSVDLPKERLQ